jgi:hypothetical protein
MIDITNMNTLGWLLYMEEDRKRNNEGIERDIRIKKICDKMERYRDGEMIIDKADIPYIEEELQRRGIRINMEVT